MKRISRLFSVVILALSFLCSATQKKNSAPFLVTSIPKSGTFMLHKLLAQLTHKQPTGASNVLTEQAITQMGDGKFLVAHAEGTPENGMMAKKTGLKTIVLIRDPRDVAVSMYYYFGKGYAKLLGVDHSQKDIILTEIIKAWDYAGNKNRPTHRMQNYYDAYLRWQDYAECYVTRFEKLIGQKGGGNADVQMEEIKNIAAFLECEVTQEEVEKIVAGLFGGTATFREGQISSWRKHFTTEHVALFKEVAGDLLISLGYEKDHDWYI